MSWLLSTRHKGGAVLLLSELFLSFRDTPEPCPSQEASCPSDRNLISLAPADLESVLAHFAYSVMI